MFQKRLKNTSVNGIKKFLLQQKFYLIENFWKNEFKTMILNMCFTI